jgi:hypothetical protein
MAILRVATIIGSLLAPLLLASSAVLAQGYPTPVGNIVITAECPDYPGGSASIFATVYDQYGSAISGASVTFSISSQAASDAGFHFTSGRLSSTATVRTDESGQASVLMQTGSAPGAYTVRAISVEKVAQVTCYLAAGKGTEPGVVLPNTGTGNEGAEQSSLPYSLGLAALASIVITSSVGVLRRRSFRG